MFKQTSCKTDPINNFERIPFLPSRHYFRRKLKKCYNSVFFLPPSNGKCENGRRLEVVWLSKYIGNCCKLKNGKEILRGYELVAKFFVKLCNKYVDFNLER